MKGHILYMILSATTAGISFMGCTDVVVDSPNDVGTTAMVVKADIDASKTRGVSDDRFDDDDAIGVVLLDNGGSTITEGDMAKYSNCKYVRNGSEFHGADMANTVYYSDASISFKALAYYPYSDSGLPFEIDTSGSGISQTKENQEKHLDILVSKCVETSLVSNKVEFTGDNAFSHVMAKLVIHFTVDKNGGFDDTLIAYDKETGDKVDKPDQDKEYDYRSEVTDFISNLKFEMTGLEHMAKITPSKVASSQSVFQMRDNSIVDLKFPINEESVNCSFPLNKSVIVTLLFIPQQTDVNITLVHPVQDGEEKFTTGKFNLDLKSGVTTFLPIRISKKGLQVNSAEIKDFEFWKSIDLGDGQFAPDIMDIGSLI